MRRCVWLGSRKDSLSGKPLIDRGTTWASIYIIPSLLYLHHPVALTFLLLISSFFHFACRPFMALLSCCTNSLYIYCNRKNKRGVNIKQTITNASSIINHHHILLRSSSYTNSHHCPPSFPCTVIIVDTQAQHKQRSSRTWCSKRRSFTFTSSSIIIFHHLLHSSCQSMIIMMWIP